MQSQDPPKSKISTWKRAKTELWDTHLDVVVVVLLVEDVLVLDVVEVVVLVVDVDVESVEVEVVVVVVEVVCCSFECPLKCVEAEVPASWTVFVPILLKTK